VLGDVQSKRSLAHRWAACDDDQVVRLQTRGLRVEIGKTGWNAGDVARIFAVIELVDPLDDLRQKRLDLDEPLLPARPFLGDRENFGLGLVEQLADLLALGVER